MEITHGQQTSEEATMDPWKDFSARHEHCLEHYLELLAEAERGHRVRAVLANRRRKAPVFAPALAWLGSWLVRRGTQLHTRYAEAWDDSVKRMKETAEYDQ
jgi:hypothetical protein